MRKPVDSEMASSKAIAWLLTHGQIAGIRHEKQQKHQNHKKNDIWVHGPEVYFLWILGKTTKT